MGPDTPRKSKLFHDTVIHTIQFFLAKKGPNFHETNNSSSHKLENEAFLP